MRKDGRRWRKSEGVVTEEKKRRDQRSRQVPASASWNRRFLKCQRVSIPASGSAAFKRALANSTAKTDARRDFGQPSSSGSTPKTSFANCAGKAEFLFQGVLRDEESRLLSFGFAKSAPLHDNVHEPLRRIESVLRSVHDEISEGKSPFQARKTRIGIGAVEPLVPKDRFDASSSRGKSASEVRSAPALPD